MNKDNHLMLEALQSKFTQGRGPVNDIVVSELHKMHNALNDMATMIDLNPSDEVDQLLSKIRDVADMLISERSAAEDDAEAIMKNHGAGQIEGGSEEAENVPAEDAQNQGLNANTLKAQKLLDQCAQLLIQASRLKNVNWNYSDENGEVDLQNALENIKDYAGQMSY
jgi:hypothetical protein